jgi:crossover junction endodeoxyribonuclease RuvC
MSIIVGIDPGTTTIGFSVIEKKNRSFVLLEYGVITTQPRAALSTKLRLMAEDLETIFMKYTIDLAVVEKLFFEKNLKTGMEVAQSRGVILYLLEKRGIPLREYTPLQVKRGLCGSGTANKKQVQNALRLLFRLSEIPAPDDAADAIGLAYIASLAL